MKRPQLKTQQKWIIALAVLAVGTAIWWTGRQPHTEDDLKVAQQTSGLKQDQSASLEPHSNASPVEKAASEFRSSDPELGVLFAELRPGDAMRPRPRYDRRSVALHRIQSEPLTEQRLVSIKDYLRRSTGQVRSDGRPDWVEASIKNDLIEWLEQQRPMIQELDEVLASIVHDSSQPVVMRDYALQHLGSWGETVYRSDAAWKSGALERIVQTLHQATDLKEQSFAGTALLSLRQWKSIPPEVFQAKTNAIVEDPEYSSLSRTTALQLLADWDAPSALIQAQQFIEAESPSELRLAAISVLGQHAENTTFLERSGLGDDPRFATAITQARQHIETRHDNHGGEG